AFGVWLQLQFLPETCKLLVIVTGEDSVDGIAFLHECIIPKVHNLADRGIGNARPNRVADGKLQQQVRLFHSQPLLNTLLYRADERSGGREWSFDNLWIGRLADRVDVLFWKALRGQLLEHIIRNFIRDDLSGIRCVDRVGPPWRAEEHS